MKKIILPLLLALGLYQATNISTSGTLPTNCSVGNVYVKTGASAGFYVCLATDTWTLLASGGTGDVTAASNIADNAIVRGDGGTKGVQQTGITIDDSNVIAFPDGVKQTFNPDGTNAGLNIGSQAGDPSALSNGDIWYNSSTNKFKCRENGATSNCIGAATSGDTYIIPTADDSDNDNTLHDDPDFVFSVSASAVYFIEMTTLWTCGNSNAPDVKIQFAFPASATITYAPIGYFTGATTTGFGSQAGFLANIQESTPSTAFAQGVLGTGITSAATALHVFAVLRTAGTSGTLQVKWAQNTTTAGNPTVRSKDSVLKYRCVSGC